MSGMEFKTVTCSTWKFNSYNLTWEEVARTVIFFLPITLTEPECVFSSPQPASGKIHISLSG